MVILNTFKIITSAQRSVTASREYKVLFDVNITFVQQKGQKLMDRITTM